MRVSQGTRLFALSSLGWSNGCGTISTQGGGHGPSTSHVERRAHILRVLAGVRAADPELANYLAASLRNGLHLMGEESNWLQLSVATSP